MHIKGCGPINVLPSLLTSCWGELNGITAASIISKVLLDFHSLCKLVHIHCDNQGVVKKCANGTFHSLRSHRATNMDLYLTQRSICHSISISLHLVKSHTDSRPWDTVYDLQQQKLSNDEIYNVWCDRAADIAWEQGLTSHFDPAVSPAEKWALFSIHPCYHKVTGNLNTGLYDALGFDALTEYISKRHALSSSAVDKVNLLALQTFL